MTRLLHLVAFLVATAVSGFLFAFADGLPEARRIAPSLTSMPAPMPAPTPVSAPDVPSLLGGAAPAAPITASELVAPDAAPASVSPSPIAPALMAQNSAGPRQAFDRVGGGVPGGDGSPGYQY